MRYALVRFLFLLSFVVAFTACDSDDSDGNGDGNGGGSIECNASGTGILGANVGSEAFCAFTVSGSAAGDTFFIIGLGSFPDAPAAGLSFNAPAAEGTYRVGPSENDTFAAFTASTDGLVYDSGGGQASGTIVVTGITEERVEGTFSFVLAEFNENTDTYTGETLTVTNGEFDVVLVDL